MEHYIFILLILAICVFIFFKIILSYKKSVLVLKREIFKKSEQLNLMNLWLRILNEGKDVSMYFLEKGYKSVAIYGMADLGWRLLEELEDSPISVKYVIDRNYNTIYCELPVYSPSDDLPEIDAIIVTAITFFDEIKNKLDNKDRDIISLNEVLMYLE